MPCLIPPLSADQDFGEAAADFGADGFRTRQPTRFRRGVRANTPSKIGAESGHVGEASQTGRGPQNASEREMSLDVM